MKKYIFILMCLTAWSQAAMAQGFDVSITKRGETTPIVSKLDASTVTLTYLDSKVTVQVTGIDGTTTPAVEFDNRFFYDFKVLNIVNFDPGTDDLPTGDIVAHAPSMRRIQSQNTTGPALVLDGVKASLFYMTAASPTITLRMENGKYVVNDVEVSEKVSAIYLEYAHNITEHEEGKTATCTSSGSHAYWYCSLCDKYFGDEACTQVITWEEIAIPVSHTYPEGATHGECTVCHKIIVAEGDDANAAGKLKAIHWQKVKNTETGTYTLEILGTGAMKDYYRNEMSNYVNTPWYNYRDALYGISVCPGITRIGNNAFNRLTDIYSVSIAEGVESIGEYAFGSNLYADEIVLPASLRTIEYNAFYDNQAKAIRFAANSQLTTVADGGLGSALIHSITFTGAKPAFADSAFYCGEMNVIYPSSWGDMTEQYGAQVITWLKDGQLSEAPTALTLNADSVTSEMTKGSARFYTFTPEQSGTYCLNIGLAEQKPTKMFVYDNAALTTYFHSSYESRSYEDGLLLEAGKTYYFKLCSYADNQLSISITTAVSSGTFGTNNALTWNYANGTLTIGGTGAVDCSIDKDYYNIGTVAPYSIFRTSVTNLVVGNGITRLGEQAFSEAYNLTTVTFEEGSACTELGIGAFNKTSISSIVLPPSCTALTAAFVHSNVKQLYISAAEFKSSDLVYFASSSSSSSIADLYNYNNAMDVYFLHQKAYDQIKGQVASTTTAHAPVCIIARLTENFAFELTSAYADAAISEFTFTRAQLKALDIPACHYAWKNGEADVAYGTTFSNVKETITLVGTVSQTPSHEYEMGACAICGADQTNLDAICFEDGTPYQRATSASVASLTYQRTFGGTNWTTWYVPFQLVLTDEIGAKYDFARINNVHQYDEKTVIESFRLNSGTTLKANYPYLVRVRDMADKDMTLTLGNVTLEAALENSFQCLSMDSKYTFTGSYKAITDVSASVAVYSLFDNSDNDWDHFSALEPQRHFLTISPRNGGSSSGTTQNAAPRRIVLEVVGDEEDTGLGSINNEQLTINNEPGVIYNLQGQRLNSPQRGVNNINGKMVLVR